MTSLALFDPDLDEAGPTTASPGGPAPAEVASAAALESFRATKHKSLNFGLGVDSTALALAVIDDPSSFGVAEDFSDFSVVTAMTGFEFPDTIADVENYVLPLFREKGIRYTQVARAGRPDSAGVEVLSDTTNPGKVFSKGSWTLMDELEENGTVPQYAGGHVCSQKHKAWTIDRLQLQRAGGQTVGKLFGYNADEHKRAVKANKFQAKRNKEAGYATFAVDYPLLRLGWDRKDVQGYVKDRLGVDMSKSYCPV
ncbi:hypothetical protein M4438_37850, partial [Streptomyces lavenduligriseus]|nr:hypothetical protein [Streptomyces lavenduligriseus]